MACYYLQFQHAKNLEEKDMNEQIASAIPGSKAQELLEDLSSWGDFTTIVFAGGSVFEFKGPFPKGTIGHGFYNLEGPTPGLHGHLNLEKVSRIDFQVKPHRGVDSYAFVFKTESDDIIFKVFLGRDENRNIISHQLEKFKAYQEQYATGEEV